MAESVDSSQAGAADSPSITNGAQSACASACGVNQANIESGTASGVGSTQVNANHIIQYPRQPKLDDGKWMAIGSLLGALLGKFADNSLINKAKDAENEWKKINQQLHAKGIELWDLAPKEKALADEADTDLANQYDWNIGQRDAELARAQQLDSCNDTLHDMMCKFATCGYTPDYDGIKARILADVAGQTKKARAEMCKNLNRYSVRQCCGIETALATTAIATTVSALYKAREDERSRAWQINEQLVFKTAEVMEQHRNNRLNSSAAFDKTGIGIQQARYTAHNGNYFDLTKLGGDFLTSAGKNYAWLADSYRKTADKLSSSLSSLGSLIAVVLSMWLGKNSGENTCGDGAGVVTGSPAGGASAGGGGGTPTVDSTISGT